MKKSILSAIVVISGIAVILAATVNVMATGDSSQNTSSGGYSQISSSSSSGSHSDTSSSSSSKTDSSSGSSSEKETPSKSDTSLKSDSSKTSSASSSDKDDKDTSSKSATGGTSSADSSSKKSTGGGVSSKGVGGGKTFIDETGSTSSVPSATDMPSEPEGEGLISSDISDENSSDISDENHFQARVTKLSGRIYKVIWIPILVSVLCVAGLVYVNIEFRKKMGSTAKHSGRRRTASHKRTGARSGGRR